MLDSCIFYLWEGGRRSYTISLNISAGSVDLDEVIARRRLSQLNEKAFISTGIVIMLLEGGKVEA